MKSAGASATAGQQQDDAVPTELAKPPRHQQGAPTLHFSAGMISSGEKICGAEDQQS
jgi:hypothetical protein